MRRMVRIGILGALQIERDGSPIEISGGRLRALLARLALAGGRPVSAGAWSTPCGTTSCRPISSTRCSR